MHLGCVNDDASSVFPMGSRANAAQVLARRDICNVGADMGNWGQHIDFCMANEGAHAKGVLRSHMLLCKRAFALQCEPSLSCHAWTV